MAAQYLAPNETKNDPTGVDEALIAAIASGMSCVKAGLAVGISESSIYRKLRNPLFKARVAEARGQALLPHVESLRREIPASIQRFIAIRDNPDSSAKDAMRAAEIVLDYFLKLENHAVIAPRLAAIEAALSEAGIDLPLPNTPPPLVPEEVAAQCQIPETMTAALANDVSQTSSPETNFDSSPQHSAPDSPPAQNEPSNSETMPT